MKTYIKILICAGASIAAAVFSVFAEALLIPVLALAAYMGAVWGAVYLLPVLIGCTAGVFLGFVPGVDLIPKLAMYLLAPSFLVLCERKNIPHRYAVLGLAAIFCLSQYLSTSLSSMLEGNAPYEGALRTWDEFYMPAFERIFGGVPGGDETVEMMGDLRSYIPDTLLAGSILTGEAYSLALVLILRLWHKAFGTKPRPMADLPDWRLPQSVLVGSGMMLAAIILAYVLKLDRANAAAWSLGLIICSLFAVQGLAYFLFMFRAVNAPGAARAVLFVLTLFLFPFSAALLAFFGIKEQIMKKRPKITKLLAEKKRQDAPYSRAEELAKYGYIRRPDHKDEDSGKDKTDGE